MFAATRVARMRRPWQLDTVSRTGIRPASAQDGWSRGMRIRRPRLSREAEAKPGIKCRGESDRSEPIRGYESEEMNCAIHVAFGGPGIIAATTVAGRHLGTIAADKRHLQVRARRLGSL